MERRKQERRVTTVTPPFPLLTLSGKIVENRRVQPDRRLNNIKVQYFGNISEARENG